MTAVISFLMVLPFAIKIILAIPITILIIYISDFIRTHGLAKIIVRFAVGFPLDGHHRTDAGFIRKGKRVRHASGHASTWTHFPHYQRMSIRWAIVTYIILSMLGMFKARMITEIGLMFTAIIALFFLSYKARKKIQTNVHTRTIHSPMTLALAPIVATTPNVIDKSLGIRPDYAKVKPGEKVGTFVIPDEFAANPAQRNAVEHLLTSRLGFDLYFRWNTAHVPRTLEIYRMHEAPNMVPFLKMVPKIRDLKGDLVALGINAMGDLICWDIASEEPMMFVSATTRRGKTRLLMLLAAQILNKGGSITAIDPKSIGLDEFCAGHPNAIVYSDPTDIQAMWDGIKLFKQELDERIAAFKKDRTIVFPRKTLFIDEVTMFARLSEQLWALQKTAKDKATPPIWMDISAIIFMGAQFNMNACVFGQRVDFRILAGLIDGFGTRMLAGFTPTTYKRLIDIPPCPKSQKNRGRFLYYNNGDEYPQWIQCVYGEIEDLRAFALEPVVNAPGVPVITIDKRKNNTENVA